ncbi:MAG TPA: universal stress protein, partial [Anaerolineales bacterium]|nr:universal stress protein [Anaerolineales bacterium]
GRAFLKQGRPVLDEAIQVGQEFEVPIRTQLRLGRRLSRSVYAAARQRNANLVLLNWTGFTTTPGSSLGRTIDILSNNPPCDLAVVRLVRETFSPHKILVPVAGGDNARLALQLAATQARFLENQTGESVQIVALHLIRENLNEQELEKRRHKLIETLNLSKLPVELKIVQSEKPDLAEEILAQAEDFDEIIIGASEEGLLEQRVFGTVPYRVAENSQVNVIMVKRYNPIKHGLLAKRLGFNGKS